MATTVPGGAYISADGKTWHDAEGKPIPAPASAKAGNSKKDGTPAKKADSAEPEKEEK